MSKHDKEVRNLFSDTLRRHQKDAWRIVVEAATRNAKATHKCATGYHDAVAGIIAQVADLPSDVQVRPGKAVDVEPDFADAIDGGVEPTVVIDSVSSQIVDQLCARFDCKTDALVATVNAALEQLAFEAASLSSQVDEWRERSASYVADLKAEQAEIADLNAQIAELNRRLEAGEVADPITPAYTPTGEPAFKATRQVDGSHADLRGAELVNADDGSPYSATPKMVEFWRKMKITPNGAKWV